jgi:chromosome segregation ATPase
MPDDDLDHIPSIVPTRDGAPRRAGGKAQSKGAASRAPSKQAAAGQGGGSGILARLFMTVSLVVAAVACAWAWQLQQQLEQAGMERQDYAQRIADLEARLSDTDEGMSQNAAVQAAKIRELDTEVRKLWDNVWKKSKARLDKLEASSASQGKKVATMEKSLSASQAQLKGAAGDIAKLKSVAGDLERLMASARANQSEVERVADTLNRINLDLAKLGKRVQANEEWVDSINAFRRQVNASLAELQTTLRSIQASPGA